MLRLDLLRGPLPPLFTLSMVPEQAAWQEDVAVGQHMQAHQ